MHSTHTRGYRLRAIPYMHTVLTFLDDRASNLFLLVFMLHILCLLKVEVALLVYTICKM